MVDGETGFHSHPVHIPVELEHIQDIGTATTHHLATMAVIVKAMKLNKSPATNNSVLVLSRLMRSGATGVAMVPVLLHVGPGLTLGTDRVQTLHRVTAEDTV